jgi:AGZA family xanthine/uracil permease-like MFS transporter
MESTGGVAFEAGVTAVLIEGCIFFVLAVSGMRYAITKLIPEPVRKSTPAAIGFFLAHIGLQSAEGIGIVVADIATGVTLGGCPIEKRTKIVALTDACMEDSVQCVTSDQYTCDVLGGVMTSGTTWVGILGLMIVVTMMAYKQRSAFIVGIGFITIISWFRNTAISYFPDTKVVRVEPLNQLVNNFTSEFKGVWGALATFVYIDFLDTSVRSSRIAF